MRGGRCFGAHPPYSQRPPTPLLLPGLGASTQSMGGGDGLGAGHPPTLPSWPAPIQHLEEGPQCCYFLTRALISECLLDDFN